MIAMNCDEKIEKLADIVTKMAVTHAGDHVHLQLVKQIVYGLCGIVLTGFVVALVALIIK